jgi:hypothetical protein
MNAVLGDEPTGAGFPRPPLAPGWLLVPFVHYLGMDIGYKVWSSVASVLPAIPTYLLARRIGSSSPAKGPHPPPRWIPAAAFAAGFILLDLLHAEMIVTGALPLIAFALLGLVWWAMGELAEDWSWSSAGVLIISLGLIPWINQTTAGLALVTIPVYGAALVGFKAKATWDTQQITGFIRYNDHFLSVIPRLAIPLFAGGVIAICALPWYLQVMPGTGLLNYPGPFMYLSPWNDSSWVQVALAVPLGLYVIWRGQQPWLRALGVLILLLAVLLPWLSTDETVINIFYRSRYLLALPWFVAITWCVFARWLPSMPPWGKTLSMALTVAAIAIMGTGYWWQFNNQTKYSDMVTHETEQALEIARASGDGKSIINNSFTLALWISAINQVESPHTWTWEPPSHWIQTDRDVRCVLGWRPECNVSESIQALNAGWILIENRFPYYNLRAPGVYGAVNVPEPWASLPTTPWLDLVYSKGTTDLYRISQ